MFSPSATASKTDNPLYKPPEEVGDASDQTQGRTETKHQPMASQPALYDNLDDFSATAGRNGSVSEVSGETNVYDTLKGPRDVW